MAVSLTPPNLLPVTTVATGDLVCVWPSAAAGPLSKITFGNFSASMALVLNTSYLQISLNLSDVGNPTTARTNLGCGTAATANIGNSGNAVPLLNTSNTWSALQLFAASAPNAEAQGAQVLNTAAFAVNNIATFGFNPSSGGDTARFGGYSDGAANAAGLLGVVSNAGNGLVAIKLNKTGQLILPAYATAGVLMNDVLGNVTSLPFSTAFQTWTPQYDFTTHGNLTNGYTAQIGKWVRVGPFIYMDFQLIFTPTYTTASGGFIIKNLPASATGTVIAGSINNHNATLTYPIAGGWLAIGAASASTARIMCLANAQAAQAITTANMPTAVAQTLEGWMIMIGA